MKFEKLKVSDITFLAVMAALLFLSSAVAMPLMTISVFGLWNMATAIFYGIIAVIALMRVPKPGALTLLGLFNSLVLAMMSPVMFFSTFSGALLAEVIVLLVARSYQSLRAIIAAAGLVIPLTLPANIVFGMLLNGQTFSEITEGSWLILLTCTGTVVLSFLGTWIGYKIGTELQKAGRLRYA